MQTIYTWQTWQAGLIKYNMITLPKDGKKIFLGACLNTKKVFLSVFFLLHAQQNYACFYTLYTVSELIRPPIPNWRSWIFVFFSFFFFSLPSSYGRNRSSAVRALSLRPIFLDKSVPVFLSAFLVCKQEIHRQTDRQTQSEDQTKKKQNSFEQKRTLITIR